MKTRESNKGFSLVELIVVVLIMGIVAVTLAPQVIKWVDKARESADFQSKDDIKGVAQIAIADYESQPGAPSLQDEMYNITSAGVSVSDGTDNNSGMIAILEGYLNGTYPQVQNQGGKIFQIQIQASGRKAAVEIVNGTY